MKRKPLRRSRLRASASSASPSRCLARTWRSTCGWSSTLQRRSSKPLSVLVRRLRLVIAISETTPARDEWDLAQPGKLKLAAATSIAKKVGVAEVRQGIDRRAQAAWGEYLGSYRNP